MPWRKGLLAPLVCSLLSIVPGPPAAAADKPTLVIRNVNLVDVDRGSIRPGRNVWIAGRRIVRIDAAGDRAIPAGITQVDATGEYLIPGLLDMHAHVPSNQARAEKVLPLFVANGVTGLRDMGSDAWSRRSNANSIVEMQNLDQKTEAGEIVGPRILRMTTGAVHGPIRIRTPTATAPSGHKFYPPKTAEDGRAIARYAKDHGIQIVKVYESVPREAYFAMLDEAQQLGVEVCGHLPKAIGLAEAAAAGQRSIEHARALPLACSPAGEQYRQIVEALVAGRSGWSIAARVESHYERIVGGYDDDLARKILQVLKKNDTYLVPTHITRRMDAMAGDETYRDDPRLIYISERLLRSWKRDADKMAAWGKRIPAMAFYQHGLRLTGLAHEAGVKIMLGTDATDTYCFPGFAAHDELLELVKAGLSPLDALRAATTVPAEYLDMTGQIGTIAAGAYADLVLLERNPLEDIVHTQSIVAVVLRGKLFDRDALDKLLAATKERP